MSNANIKDKIRLCRCAVFRQPSFDYILFIGQKIIVQVFLKVLSNNRRPATSIIITKYTFYLIQYPTIRVCLWHCRWRFIINYNNMQTCARELSLRDPQKTTRRSRQTRVATMKICRHRVLRTSRLRRHVAVYTAQSQS